MTPDTISSTYPGEGIRGCWWVAPTDAGGPPRLFRPVGPRDFPFEASSGFTHVAARRLADPPTVGLCPKSFDQLVTPSGRLGSS